MTSTKFIPAYFEYNGPDTVVTQFHARQWSPEMKEKGQKPEDTYQVNLSTMADLVLYACREEKFKYDQCFNHWYRHHFLRGDISEKSCQKDYDIYKQCATKALERRGLGSLCGWEDTVYRRPSHSMYNPKGFTSPRPGKSPQDKQREADHMAQKRLSAAAPLPERKPGVNSPPQVKFVHIPSSHGDEGPGGGTDE
ncbi:unnamed protein product [Vitrella brassicaformis CCMP3155]|uniref:Uncharacterized protein n=2 Tax=Vitrella brassicaformis TaxID=1169539 RepID=A0A0G4ELZ5_VITBC|nr:unnamed protein product [Vitrella brassicaformis CCMP3155]|eukprot:CEL98449.1 unnamed protein product [Vitrella brassicaformis CCMP3155]